MAKAKINTKVAKVITGAVEAPATKGKQKRYFHVSRVDSRKNDGWKVVSEKLDKHNRGALATKDMGTPSDLVLMEK